MEDLEESKWEKKWLPDSQLYVYVHKITGEQSKPIIPKCSCRCKQWYEEDIKVKEETFSMKSKEGQDKMTLASPYDEVFDNLKKSKSSEMQMKDLTRKEGENSKRRNSRKSKCEGGDYQCNKCKKGMKTLKLLKSHSCFDNHFDYICSTCGKRLKKLSTIRSHVKNHGILEKMSYEQAKSRLDLTKIKHQTLYKSFKAFCLTCKKILISFEYATGVHLKIHSGEKPFICSHCGKAFCHNSFLFKHKSTHFNRTKFKCNICGKGFASSSTLSHHHSSHSDSRPYKCSKCDMTFKLSSNLSQHTKYKHSPFTFICDQCPKRFARQADLQRHSVVHTDNYSHKCLKCDKAFKWPHNLKEHQKTHAKKAERLFQCSVCDKRFFSKRSLERHMKSRQVHNNLNKIEFPCEECDKIFSRKYNLKKHKLELHNVKH